MSAVHYQHSRFPPEEHLDWPTLVPYLGAASAAVARYDGMLEAVPNPDLLLAPLLMREAVLSSRIEGTQASVSDVLEIEAKSEEPADGRLQDAREIRNYFRAMRESEQLLGRLPLSGRVIRAAHTILLSDVRGQGMSPGAYRSVPNWIGPPGCSIEEATYVPVNAQDLPNALSRWERYIHARQPDALIQAAALHAEFEALHPFFDGNGRVGRMLVPLFLWKKDVIRRPAFYISEYLEAHREEYYERLLAISRDGDWSGWCRFILIAMRKQAEASLAKTQRILSLYEAMTSQVSEATRSRYATHALDAMFTKPIFRASDFAKLAEIPSPTAHRILHRLRACRILEEIRPSKGRRPAILAYWDLIRVLEEPYA